MRQNSLLTDGVPIFEGQLSRDECERAAAEALDSLPKRFADLVENVIIVVEDEPSLEDLACIGGGGASELLGLYRGVALTERGSAAPILPDRITLFRGPINRISRSRAHAVARIHETILHEIGHYFGLDDAAMRNE